MGDDNSHADLEKMVTTIKDSEGGAGGGGGRGGGRRHTTHDLLFSSLELLGSTIV